MSAAAALRIALVGNPNCGKTALFNQLTGSRQKVANFAGVTVERKAGRLTTPSGRHIEVLDLPGAYSLESASPDEAITREVCTGRLTGEPAPDLLVFVADATNLRLHLRMALELKRLGRPMVLALNMIDAARRQGLRIDRATLERRLGLPVVETIAVKHGGAEGLIAALDGHMPAAPAPLPEGADVHAQVRALLAEAVVAAPGATALEDAIDRWTLHSVIGPLLLAVVLFLMFQAVYVWAEPIMGGIETATAWLGEAVSGALPEGPLRSLLVEGVIAGLGGVIVFLPQILILFAFILALEESGYLPRAAFLLDRLMVGAGLTGRAFIPLLSSYACAIPGIMATRSIPDPRERLATILIAPLMTCSARLPVYALLIGAFIPAQTVGGVFDLRGLVLFGLYVAGILGALAVAWTLRRFRRDRSDRSDHMLLMELPAYRMPHPRDLLIGLWERTSIFLRRVGGVILTLTILLWFLASFPAPPPGFEGAPIDYSLAGRMGKALEVVFAPIGFNWQICIALVPGLAAREVAVSSLATVYALSATDDNAGVVLGSLISQDWTLATALSLLAWYVFAPMCLSTIAVIRRETNRWSTALWAAGYLAAMAYAAAFVTYRIALWLS